VHRLAIVAKRKKRSIRAKAPKAKKATILPPRPSASEGEGHEPAVEQRASPRVSLAVELHLASESHFFSGLSGDISEGGVFVSTYRDLALGSEVDVEFTLPGESRIVRARGQIRWQRESSIDAPPGVGIAFEALAEEDRHLIHEYCTVRPPLYYDVG
jgi:uncharacterized protein (TIGR02266 family)